MEAVLCFETDQKNIFCVCSQLATLLIEKERYS